MLSKEKPGTFGHVLVVESLRKGQSPISSSSSSTPLRTPFRTLGAARPHAPQGRPCISPGFPDGGGTPHSDVLVAAERDPPSSGSPDSRQVPASQCMHLISLDTVIGSAIGI